ncbi:MAG: GntR family transcriptional regulator [Nocardioidaceae bacterium]|nr:GntR family transcriptional regulator [Nocardioidaceae bacterium]NUS50838.1 GntR family transcriptional regulator [Nocardioidaceae bacterium]
MSTTPESAADRAYRFAKWAILSGVYPAGAAITEAGLAREIGVSRTPVRAALLRLEVEELVTSTRQGAVVNTFSMHDVEDVLEARVLVENHTALKSFANRAELLPLVEAAHAATIRKRREHDTAGFTAADREFHELIVDAADNRVLSSIYRTLRERQTLFTSVIMRGREDRMQEAIDEHERILQTLRGDDQAAFSRAVNDHLQWSIALARASVEVPENTA